MDVTEVAVVDKISKHKSSPQCIMDVPDNIDCASPQLGTALGKHLIVGVLTD